MGNFAYIYAKPKASEALFLEFLKATGGNLYEIYYNVGSIYYRKGDYQKAIYCYERVVRETPSHTLAIQRLNEMRRKTGRLY